MRCRYHDCSRRDEPHATAARPIRDGRCIRSAAHALSQPARPRRQRRYHAPSRPGRSLRSRYRRQLRKSPRQAEAGPFGPRLLRAVPRRRENCGYYTFNQCLASISGVGGYLHRRADPDRGRATSYTPRGSCALCATRSTEHASLPGCTKKEARHRCRASAVVWLLTCAYACWIAESSQLPPRARVKVHTSVASCGASLPSAALPVARST